MKKKYVAPEMKLFAISADERIAAECGGSSFTFDEHGCNEQLVSDDPTGCTFGTDFTS